jgi:3',5'-cyclic-nucleotide phosphodiesterase
MAPQPEWPQRAIRQELDVGNDLGVEFVIPEQGALYHFQ